ncbi:MAG: TIGR03032 family protein [Pseudomonadales bacterium]|nr:TIGR03032 family protein [Pseudomonadales bacterium]
MSAYGTDQPAPQDAVKLSIEASPGLTDWLSSMGVSLAFSTYQTGKLFFVGQQSGNLSVFERTFDRCMGLCTDDAGQTLWMSSRYQLWKLTSAFRPGTRYQGYDRLYVPRVGYTTGDLDIHDVAIDDVGKPVFVSTLFSCLGTLSDQKSFEPLWKPGWISRLAPEDRCHLNGLAMDDGKPRFVTSVSCSDVADGWREQRSGGGVVADVASGEIVCSGLSMPHSPRLYRDRLWLLDAGTGYFGYVDLASGRFDPLVFCPGFLRGLAFRGDFAIVGLSAPRQNKTFRGLPLDGNLAEKGAAPRCGLMVINLNSGTVSHSLQLSGIVEELYDVVVLPGASRPMALGFKSDEISRVLSVDEDQFEL